MGQCLVLPSISNIFCTLGTPVVFPDLLILYIRRRDLLSSFTIDHANVVRSFFRIPESKVELVRTWKRYFERTLLGDGQEPEEFTVQSFHTDATQSFVDGSFICMRDAPSIIDRLRQRILKSFSNKSAKMTSGQQWNARKTPVCRMETAPFYCERYVADNSFVGRCN